MKAWQIENFGDTDALQLREVADPVPEDNEVVVSTYAFSINPADGKLRAGTSPAAANISFPQTLGRDFSGVIESVGAGVTDLRPGDEVFGVLDRGHEGAYAEKIALDAALVALKPAELTHLEAAAMALTGLTALVALEDVARVERGQKVLIQGAAGGVGSFAIQYCRHVGAEIYATASERNHAYVKELGADHAIDYTSGPFEDAVPELDLVFDTVGGEVHRRSATVLKRGGLLVHIAAGPKDMKAPEGIRIVRPFVGRDRPHLERICELATAGIVRPPEIKAMNFSDVPKGHELIDSGHVRGKLVFEVSSRS